MPARALTRALAATVVDAPAAGGRGPDAEPLIAGGPTRLEPERQATAETNREAYQDNRRDVAAMLLARVCCATVCLAVVSAALLLSTILVYYRGYGVYARTAGKPCDEPLSGWLAAVLTVLPLRVVLAVLYRYLRAGQLPMEEHTSCAAKAIYLILKGWHLVGNPVLIVLGFHWYRQSETCYETSPNLFSFVRLFLIYQLVMWAGGVLIFFGATSFVLWAHRNNLLELGPGPHAAAKPGVIDKIESVRYDPSLFRQSTDAEGEKEPPECCVCSIAYDEGSSIKRTPCGHYFHEECLGNWLGKYAKTCPLCRNNLEDAVESGQGVV